MTNNIDQDDVSVRHRASAHLRAYLLMNALIYALFLAGMGAALLFPDLRTAQITAQQEDGPIWWCPCSTTSGCSA